jgi:hypothetical protein
LTEGVRDRARTLALLTPWVSVPLAVLGVTLGLSYPLLLVSDLGWICYPVAVALAVALALFIRSRYRVAVLDSSHLGVFYWLQRR